ncbi:MAG: hypothetical protein M3154_04760 [Candidatus Eremiobacteraeota bacterium]|nr:hypothetical protein [Candidatus Eremiobacteraeota bacterium]
MLQRFADALAVSAEGVPVRAFGAWAAFGMVDWVSLLCRRERACEDGIYTCAAPGELPARTLVADVIAELSVGRTPAQPDELGWWERGRPRLRRVERHDEFNALVAGFIDAPAPVG